MRIGIDVSQLAYQNTGVANYLKNLVENMIEQDTENEYVLFYSSMRIPISMTGLRLPKNRKVQIKSYRYPPLVLELIWNRFHIVPIEEIIGRVDVFLSSDWLQPPSGARNISIIYDLIVYEYPEETHNQFKFSFKKLRVAQNIVKSQKRRLKWVKKECDIVLTISESTKKDIIEILKIPEEKIRIIYPGFTL